MDDPTDPAAPAWSSSPSAKARNAVQKAVTALLDELAPEKALTRGERVPLRIEQHRTPTGCVLQAATAALSVSWFADQTNDAAMGELRVILWRGTLSRRGSPARREPASVLSELTLAPFERAPGEWFWRGADGIEYGTASLAARCLALLEEQIDSRHERV